MKKRGDGGFEESDSEFLLWVYNRLRFSYLEDPNFDFMQRLKAISEQYEILATRKTIPESNTNAFVVKQIFYVDKMFSIFSSLVQEGYKRGNVDEAFLKECSKLAHQAITVFNAEVENVVSQH